MRTLALSLALLVLACSKEPNRWEAAEQQAARTAEAPAAQAPTKIEGSTLNSFFPTSGPDGASRVFTVEKDGYVEAKLVRQDGTDLAMLSVSQASPEAATKFQSASDNVSGFPLVTVGNNQSSVLVNKKLQVKVSSKELPASDRKSLLAKFDLEGLASL